MSLSSYNPFALSFVRQGRRWIKYLPEGNYRKIPKISAGAYIFQRPFLWGLFLEGLIYGRKFASQNRLGYRYSWKEIYRFCFVLLCIWGQFPSTSPPGGLLFWRGDLTEGFFRYEFGGLTLGGAYFRNFTVLLFQPNDVLPLQDSRLKTLCY